MVEILECSDFECKISMINMVSTLMEKVDVIQEQLDNVSREIETLNNQKEMLEIKNTNRNEE